MVRISWSALLLGSLVSLPIAAVAQGLPTPKDASLYIISPKDGATISGPFWCIFGLRGMGISHAGDQFPNSGHHHLLIDVDEPLSTLPESLTRPPKAALDALMQNLQ